MSNRCCQLILLLLLSSLAFLFLSPTPRGTEPTSLPPFELKQTLVQMTNIDFDRLKNARYLKLPKTVVEDVAVTSNGQIYAIAGNGPSDIYRISPANYSLHTKIAETPGRVLGTALNEQQTMLAFMDEKLGIRIMNLETSQIRTVASQYQGRKFTSPNSVTFTSDPDILYFTDSCTLTMEEYHLQLLYKTGTGSIYRLNIRTGQIEPILTGLQFPNGIVYSKKQHCLYVNIIGLYQVIRVPLASQQPTYTVVVDNLLGYPDNLKITEDNKLWVAFPSLRDAVTVTLDNHPIIRKALINARIPEHIFTSLANFKYSGGVKIDPETGSIVDYFFGKSDQIYFVTSIVERNQKVYLTSLKQNLVAVVDYL